MGEDRAVDEIHKLHRIFACNITVTGLDVLVLSDEIFPFCDVFLIFPFNRELLKMQKEKDVSQQCRSDWKTGVMQIGRFRSEKAQIRRDDKPRFKKATN